MQKILLIAGVCAFALGVGLRSVIDISLPTVVWILFLSLVLALLWRRKSVPFLLFPSVCLLFIALGIFRTEVATWQFGISSLEEVVEDSVKLRGVVVTEPDVRERTVHLFVETGTDKILVTADRLTDVSYGDLIEISGTIKKPNSFTTDLGRTFNYAGYLQAKGVEYVVSFADVEIIESGLGNPIISTLLTTKKIFLDSIKKIIPEPAVGLGSGLLLGVKSALGEDIESDFRRTGIIHIVVLSGYNVMLVVAFILFAFSFFMNARWRLIAGIIAITAFALIVGLSATVVRASIMAVLVLIAQSFGRQYDVFRALLFAGLVMILINPYLLVYDIGFQLSFMATLGLLLIVPHFETKSIEGKGFLGIRDFFLATVSTQIAVLPLLLYHIGEISLIAVVVNILVLPIVPVAMLLTFITGIVGLVSINVASVFGFVTTLSLGYILFIAKWFASLPFAAVSVPQFSFIGVVLLYGCFAGIYWYVKTHKNEDNTLSGWEIVDEEKESDSILNNSSDIESTSKSEDDVPVFFR